MTSDDGVHQHSVYDIVVILFYFSRFIRRFGLSNFRASGYDIRPRRIFRAETLDLCLADGLDSDFEKKKKNRVLFSLF